MKNEITKINTPGQLKKIMEGKKIRNQKTPDKIISPELVEVKVETPVNKVSFGEKMKSLFERKISGAVSELFKRKELDVSVEENLSSGLENNEEFAAASNKIDKKRSWFVSRFANLLKRKSQETPEDSVKYTPYVFDEAAEQAMKELEQELSDSFTKGIYNRLAEANKRILLDHLVDNPAEKESKIIELPTVSDANDNVVAFSDNGYLMQLANKGDVKVDGSINIESELAIYNLIAPNGQIIAQKLNYLTAQEKLKTESAEYQKNLIAELTQQEIIQKNLLDRERELKEIEAAQEGGMDEREQEMNKLMDEMLEDDKNIALSKQQEENFFNGVDSEPTLESAEPTTITLENDSKDDVSIVELTELEQNNETETPFVNPFNEKVSKYAESIGIKPEQLAVNSEFLLLSPEQQQFALETLRRSSLAKVKVEAHESFTKEKASKKWWQIGFALNQNYHKERHKIEAIKNIESRGLEGYGETELAWLVDVIKNGPEIKINDAGEVLVNCLKEENFSEEQRELIAKYNSVAREYINTKNKPDEEYNLRDDLDAVRVEILNQTNSYDERKEVNELFLRSKNNAELLKFLSADQETEKMLDKMASTSTDGFSKLKGIALGQKDKAGYSALGFALRTGSKFALANSAYLASALSYSVAPAVAAIIGGFRGYNLGKKELSEKEELAQLGIQDQSGLTQAMNLAVGKKETENGNEINFGFQDKLESLMDKVKTLREQSAPWEEIEKIQNSLVVRINYTEKKINREEVNFGSISERNINYFNLINTIAEAKSLVGINSNHYQFDENFFNFDPELNTYGKNIDLTKKENESPEEYQSRIAKYKSWATDEKRLEELGKISLDNRLSSFLAYKEEQQYSKEAKFLRKKVISGALMGAGFAAAGAFVAEHLNVAGWFHHSSGSSSATETSAALSSKTVNVSHPTNTVENVTTAKPTNTDVINQPSPKAESVIETPKTQTVDASQESVQREPEIKIEPIKAKPIEITAEKPINASEQSIQGIKVTTPEKVVELPDQNVEGGQTVTTSNNIEVSASNNPVATETPNIQTTEVISNPVSANSTETISQEVIDAKKAAVAMKEIINTGNRAAKLADGVYSNSPSFRSEGDFLKQVAETNNIKLNPEQELEAKNIYNSFKSNQDYNILRRRLVSFEDKIVSQNASINNEVVEPAIETSAPVNPVTTEVPVVTTETPNIQTTEVISNPVSANSTETISQEVIDAKKAAVAMKEIINTGNRAAKLADGVYSNSPSFRSEGDFLKQVAETNNIKLNPEQELEAKNIYNSFKSNQDYNILRRRLVSFEDKIVSQPVTETAVVSETVPTAEQVTRIADTSAIAEELHIKPELLKQVGEDLVYKGKENSSIIFDLKQGGIKEAVDASGKKIPNSFVKELIGTTKMNKFTKSGGLEKIFSTWSKLGANDKLVYESLNWFSTGKLSSNDLIDQIRGLYQVKTENVYIDDVNKQFTTGDGSKFDMTLKGIKKLIAVLPKK